jgi:hypothetical protein
VIRLILGTIIDCALILFGAFVDGVSKIGRKRIPTFGTWARRPALIVLPGCKASVERIEDAVERIEAWAGARRIFSEVRGTDWRERMGRNGVIYVEQQFSADDGAHYVAAVDDAGEIQQVRIRLPMDEYVIEHTAVVEHLILHGLGCEHVEFKGHVLSHQLDEHAWSVTGVRNALRRCCRFRSV